MSAGDDDQCFMPPPDVNAEKTTVHPGISGFQSARSHDRARIGWQSKPSGTHLQTKSIDMNDTKSLTLPPLQRSYTDIGGLRTMYKRARSPTPNHTMINRRDQDLLKTPAFHSLSTVSRPIPNLLDKPSKERDFPKKPMRLWRDEVKKVVPSRPPIAIANNYEAPPAEWDDRDQYIYGAKPVFYKNIKYTLHKDFVVNPEWLSEFMTVSTYSPAYRTCALRYGWCA